MFVKLAGTRRAERGQSSEVEPVARGEPVKGLAGKQVATTPTRKTSSCEGGAIRGANKDR